MARTRRRGLRLLRPAVGTGHLAEAPTASPPPVLTGGRDKQSKDEPMRKRVLFIHGGGEGAYKEGRKLAASLQDTLGTAYDVQVLKMPNEDRPVYEA